MVSLDGKPFTCTMQTGDSTMTEESEYTSANEGKMAFNGTASGNEIVCNEFWMKAGQNDSFKTTEAMLK